ncbi:ATP-binding protein [Herbiconiux sp. CPCC 203407]|uniref:ATP-binding protein n=1 Tax=Herbiconiux oxytropis TaxID=2970915 RepID=A0AA41XKB5_9MICO|nr:ATP-binding protein [Herbiconiux oxytropis]MCS5722347.1 ATP-binding protein [Herbiconiux oxytropis]MCS5727256.1 ATP-binding protein [Herbiconiux oxytropis]
MDERTQEFVETFRVFLEEVVQTERGGDDGLSPLGELVEAHLGSPVRELPVITHTIAAHRLVDADLALSSLADASGAAPLGVSGGQMRDQCALPELLAGSRFARFAPGPIDYVSVADGPDSVRRVMSFGLVLLHFEGAPVVALQRAAKPERGRAAAALEVLAADPDVAGAFLAEFSRLMLSLSVLRGQVLSFTASEYGNGAAGATFLPRPQVAADDVILAPGVLESVTRHVVGVGEQRERLREAGQHLKRGVLLYGPPGTGKTLTVRHLLSRTPDTTAVLLTGPSIRFITEAAELARAMQPAVVVLEDVDLVAQERGLHGPQPLLFAVLDALDGLDGDADVAFVLTTNRVEMLERALAERPGRVDLAVEVALPDDEARRRLFHRYAQGLPLGADAIDAAADRAAGTTGSFAKELMRRAVLAAAEADRAVTDADLAEALDSLLSAGARLTRSLLGGGGSGSGSGHRQGDGAAAEQPEVRLTAGWTAYSPRSGQTFEP